MVSDSLGVAANQVGQSGDNHENVGNYGRMIVVDLIIMFINRSALPLRRVWQNSLKIAGVFRWSSYYFLFRHLNSTTSHIINTSQFSLETNQITIILPKSSSWSSHLTSFVSLLEVFCRLPLLTTGKRGWWNLIVLNRLLIIMVQGGGDEDGEH